MKSEDVGLIVRAISFQDFQPMWSWSTNVTDRQTDRRTDDMWSQDRVLHYSASRGKNHKAKHHRGSVFFSWHFDMLCTSGFVDDVMFSHIGPFGAYFVFLSGKRVTVKARCET